MPASSAPTPPPPPEQTLLVEGRRSMVRSFKEWWHEESLARAAEKNCPVSKVLNAEITMDFSLG